MMMEESEFTILETAALMSETIFKYFEKLKLPYPWGSCYWCNFSRKC